MAHQLTASVIIKVIFPFIIKSRRAKCLSSFIYSVGDMIALGSQNGCIYLFRVSRDGFSYKKLNKIRGSQPLQHLDWSIDAFYLQSVTVDFDLLFCTYWKFNLFLFGKLENNLICVRFLTTRGCTILVTRTQSDCNERHQMVESKLYSWIFGGWHVEQSLLFECINHNNNMQSCFWTRYACVW